MPRPVHIRLLPLLALFLPLVVGAASPPSLTPGPKDRVEQDLWFNGWLDGQPLGNMHLVQLRHADGSRSALTESQMIIKRRILTVENVVRMRETGLWRESAEGRLSSFRLFQEEGGNLTRASGTIVGREVQAVIERAGRRHEQIIPLPEGVELEGMETGQQRMLSQLQQPDDSARMHSLVLMAGQLRLTAIDATLVEALADGGARYRLVMELAPMIGMQMETGPDLLVRSMQMDFGPLSFRFARGEGPIALGDGAPLAMTELVETRGPAPRSGAVNRYRLPAKALAQLPVDAFQRVEGELLLVKAQARPGPLEDPAPYLQAEPMLELDAPELRDWVGSLLATAPADLAGRAEHLRLAVRDHIRGDFSRGDASALEAFRDRRGDCTEYSHLLCAALRIAGIPARIDVGLVFALELGGWGGHAWVSAYDAEAGRWLNLDAAYPDVPRSRYIRTGSASNIEAGGTNALLDRGMGLLMGQWIEVVPGP
ncbi:MAG: transglutaminase domain-containing protein [Chromatiaceae bacterium]|nr:MAG: transglutaminase domain-containing protein [Chromatiaceae bacterium]